MSGFPNVRKKTPFERHKELEEQKKKRAEEEAARLYEDFVESFADKEEDKTAPKAFVRGGVVQPGSAPTSAPVSATKKPGGKYVPSFIPPMMAAALSGDSKDTARSDESIFPLPSTARNERGKQRNIDKMLETMKREQEAREERQKARKDRGSSFDTGPLVDDGMGSFDDGDPYTTNLYVGNLAPTVDEEVLKREFLRFGDIASIKIMWPRDDDQRRRGRNCGFVAYMTREGADRAKDELNGALLHDLELRIGWGKAVILPPIPMYNASGGRDLGSMIAAAKGAIGMGPPHGDGPTTWGIAPVVKEEDPHSGTGPEIVIQVPADARVRFIIDSVAVYVLSDGCAFEQLLMTHEAHNPEFKFLFDLQAPEHAYYRWRVYSLAQGDSLRSWRVEPFVMVEGGPRWVPPGMTSMAGSSHQTAAQRGGEAREKDKPLPDLQRDRFEDLLRALTLERSKICEAMIFALDNAESAYEVVETLTDSLTLSETPMDTKVARLMLASDILHNSTAHVRNASRYRSLLEASLPEIFESLQETYRGLESRMTQEVLRRHILRLLRVWRSWFIFTDDFLNGLQATFLKGKSAASNNPELRAELEALDSEALATRCRRNGLAREGGSEAQIARLLDLHAYISGDVKPEPLAAASAVQQEALPMGLAKDSQGVFSINATPAETRPQEAEVVTAPKPVTGPVSKWEAVDYDAEAQAFPGVKEDEGNIFSDDDGGATPVVESGVAPAPDSSPEPDALHPPPLPPEAKAEEKPPEATGGAERMDGADEERRQKLRQVEVAVLMFREQLEDEGLPRAVVDGKVAEHRAKLVAEAEAPPAASEPSTSTRDAKQRDRAKVKVKNKGDDSEPSSSRQRGHDSGKTGKGRTRERSRSPGSQDRRRDKDREKDAKRERSGSRSREREKERERRRERSQSRERERERARRDRSGSRDRERERERRVRERSESRERRRSESGGRRGERRRTRSRERKPRSSSRERRREAEKGIEKDKKRGRSGSRGREKEREGKRDMKRGRSSSRGREREGRRENSPKKSSAKSSKRDSKRHRS